MAQILILDDDPNIRLLLEQVVTLMGHKASSAGSLQEGLQLSQTNAYDLILLDLDFPEGNGLEILPDLINLPNSPEVIIITGTGDQHGAEIAFNYGAWDFVKKPFLKEEVSLPITRALQYHEEKAKSKATAVLKRGTIIGESPMMLQCLDEAARAAATDSSVLIGGETGTGKELFARAIHESSPRAKGNFIVIDCGALPETLVESILFGHVKGAFTGANYDKEGLITQARGGTLFLDEIGELPPAIQKTLLRTLQEHSVRRVGGKGEIPVDFRLVAATNRNLEAMTQRQTFREDLLFRIRGIEIMLPPLRDRIEDIQDIVHYKLRQFGKLYGVGIKGVAAEFIQILEKHQWPGNVRELINVLEHSLSNAGDDPTLVPKHLPSKYRAALLNLHPRLHRTPTSEPGEDGELNTEGTLLKWSDYRLKVERDYLQSLLYKSNGNWEIACALSGLSKTRFYELLRKHHLSLSAIS